MESRYGRRMSRIGRISTCPMHGVSTETSERERRTVTEERPKAGVDEEEHKDDKSEHAERGTRGGRRDGGHDVRSGGVNLVEHPVSISGSDGDCRKRGRGKKNSQVTVASRQYAEVDSELSLALVALRRSTPGRSYGTAPMY